MKLSGNTILITGGSSGIGLELCRQLLKRNNKIIICGRSHVKLKAAKHELPQLHTYQCDISKKSECVKFTDWLKTNFKDLNVLINNAALVHKEPFFESEKIIEKAELEIATNFFAPLCLSYLLYPVIKNNYQSTIINITTGLVYTPRADYSFYNATKAALHSFTQVLRMQNKNKDINIVEVLFPAVNTPWHNGNPPKISISAEKAVSEMLLGLSNGKTEIKIGKVKLLYTLSRIAPNLAVKKINSLND